MGIPVLFLFFDNQIYWHQNICLFFPAVYSMPEDQKNKYDVKDYKAIDSTFGTLEDYDALVTKCHDNHMSIIL